MAEPQEATAVPESAEPKKKSKLTMWIILGAALVLLGGAGILVRHYMGGSPPAAEGNTEKGEPGGVRKVKSMINLDAFLVNLADTDSTRFVKVTFRLGLDEASLGEELAGDPIVLSATRDKIISLISTKSAEELLTVEGKDKLRNEIRERVNPILPKGKIVEVFIIEFVVQM